MRINQFRRLLITLALLCYLDATSQGQTKLVSQKVTLNNGKSFSLNLPVEFEIIPAAEGLKRVRFFARSPDGRIFVTDMYNLADNNRGKIYILDGWDPDTGKFSKVIPYLSDLHNPNSVHFYRDANGEDWLYIAETGRLTRRRFKSGEIKPSDTSPQTIATFPDYGLSYKYGGWHLTRTIAFSPNGKLFVSVGSSCNSCVEKEEVRASIIEMNPDGTGRRLFASGLRNAVGLRWVGNTLLATNQGSDHLGTSRPDETFYAVKDGADYGWPYCHSANGKIIADPKLKRSAGCTNVPTPYAFFPARSSALGFDYFDDPTSADSIKNGFLVALHGSSNKTTGTGYKIVIMREGSELQDFLTGFLSGRTVHGRPCDILKLDANSFLFSDDHTGVVYYVRKKGSITQIAEDPTKTSVSPSPNREAGANGQGEKSCFALAFILGVMVLRSLV